MTIHTATASKGDIGVYVKRSWHCHACLYRQSSPAVCGAIIASPTAKASWSTKATSCSKSIRGPIRRRSPRFKGQLAHDQAVLQEAHIDLDRYQSAFSETPSPSNRSTIRSKWFTRIEGTVKNDQGQVDNAKVNLVYCHITSPIDGRVGLRLVDPGNIVQANSTTPLW